MPNRIIHEKALKSDTLAKLSAEAERLFWRLTAIADDQGRFDAYPPTVKAECFPRLVDQIKTKDVITWMCELAQECICLYTVEERQYGYFVKWPEYQRVYGNKPKFPQPPADCGSSPQNPALILTLTPITTPTTISIGRPAGSAAKQKVMRSITDEDCPTEKHKALAQSLRVDLGAEWGKFKNYCLAHDKRYANFEAAFRNWIANSVNMRKS